MFSGIIQNVGLVRQVASSGAGRRLAIDLGPLAEGLARGDSVAVAGACLSAVEIRGGVAEFDVVAETLSRTTLGALQSGSRVNLERSLRLGEGLEGHLVQGHVDGVARVRAIRRQEGHVVEFQAGTDLTGAMVPKGSVAIDGVSLTLLDVAEGSFSAALVPITLEKTTLGELAPGSQVNVETDLIGKYVLRHLCSIAGRSGGALTLEKLREAGFA
jgi:riboflavin synthase